MNSTSFRNNSKFESLLSKLQTFIDSAYKKNDDDLVKTITYVVEQIAEVGVENLAVADEQTIKVVQAVVAEVVDKETVNELSEEGIREFVNVKTVCIDPSE